MSVSLIENVTSCFTAQWLAFDSPTPMIISATAVLIAVPVTLWMSLSLITLESPRVISKLVVAIALPIYLVVGAYRISHLALWMPISEVQTGQARYRAYITYYDLFGRAVVLRKEQKLLPGLVLVKEQYAELHCSNAELTSTISGQIHARGVCQERGNQEWSYEFGGT